jgi:hypothetical protein
MACITHDFLYTTFFVIWYTSLLLGLMDWCSVVVVLNAISVLVFLNKLVIFLIYYFRMKKCIYSHYTTTTNSFRNSIRTIKIPCLNFFNVNTLRHNQPDIQSIIPASDQLFLNRCTTQSPAEVSNVFFKTPRLHCL